MEIKFFIVFFFKNALQYNLKKWSKNKVNVRNIKKKHWEFEPLGYQEEKSLKRTIYLKEKRAKEEAKEKAKQAKASAEALAVAAEIAAKAEENKNDSNT